MSQWKLSVRGGDEDVREQELEEGEQSGNTRQSSGQHWVHKCDGGAAVSRDRQKKTCFNVNRK